MIWAALSGVPCLRSWPLIANTLSLFLSFPSWAAKPPVRRSRMKTPLSSDLRMSLMPSGSERWLFISVTCRTVPGLLEVELPCGLVEDWEAAGAVLDEVWWSDRASLGLKPFSCITVSLRWFGCRSTTMARVWGTKDKLTSLTWKPYTTKKVQQLTAYRDSRSQVLPCFECVYNIIIIIRIRASGNRLLGELLTFLTAFVYLRPLNHILSTPEATKWDASDLISNISHSHLHSNLTINILIKE